MGSIKRSETLLCYKSCSSLQVFEGKPSERVVWVHSTSYPKGGVSFLLCAQLSIIGVVFLKSRASFFYTQTVFIYSQEYKLGSLYTLLQGGKGTYYIQVTQLY